jgi:hypothetical protein
VATGIATVVFLGSVLAVFFYIHRYAVDVVYADQWSDVALLERANHGTLSLGALWAQHNENRILVPNLAVLALGYTTHFRVVVEDYLSGVALCGSTALLVLAHRRRSPTVPWIAYTPPALVLTSFVVVDDALFGFNFSWFLVLLGLSAAVFLADREELTPWWLAAAVVAGVAGSMSSLQGLLIWPAVLVVLWLRRRPGGTLAVWAGAGIVTGIVYFLGFDFARSAASSSLELGARSQLDFFVSELGNVVGSQTAPSVDRFIGIGVLVVAVGAVAVGVRRGTSGGGPVGAGLVVFGILFSAVAALGRAQLGLVNSLRYAPFVLLAAIGAYLVLLPLVIGDGRLATARPEPPPGVVAKGPDWTRTRSDFVRSLFVVLAVAMVFHIYYSDTQGVDDAIGWQGWEMTAANVEANVSNAPPALVASALGPSVAPDVPALARFARADHLSLFDTGLGAAEIRRGLDTHLLTAMVEPQPGAYVSGNVGVAAVVLAKRPTGVEIVVATTDGYASHACTAVRSGPRYTCTWNSLSVTDGIYFLESRATLSTGAVYTSLPWPIVVTNGQ